MEFKPFPKIPRWSDQHIVISEKIDGTNAQIVINEDCTEIRAGSRSRWITPDDDNFGFARWVEDNREALLTLGKGQHFGEWWGQGIQRCYNLKYKVFSLFNTLRWSTEEQQAKLDQLWADGVWVNTVPILYQGEFSNEQIDHQMNLLDTGGSIAAPGFENPEGVVIYIPGSRSLFKKTIGGNNPKGK